MADKNKDKQKCKTKVQKVLYENTQITQSNEHVSEQNELNSKISWPYLFPEVLKNHTNAVSAILETVSNQVNDQDISALTVSFTTFQKQIKSHLDFLVETYNDFVLPKHSEILREKENLMTVNRKILERLHSMTSQNKQDVISDQKTFINKHDHNKELSRFVHNKATQTDISDQGFRHNVLQQQKVINDSHDSSLREEVFKNHLNDSEILEVSLNCSFNSPIKRHEKPIRVIICELPVQFNIPDILIGISDIVKTHVSSINFVKKYKLNYADIYNWILDISPEIAKQLLRVKEIPIQTKLYPVKKFVVVKRCFRCQTYKHIAKFCDNNIKCSVCAGPHNNTNCTNFPKCINCIINNENNNTSFDTSHAAFARDCPSLKKHIEDERNLTFI